MLNIMGKQLLLHVLVDSVNSTGEGNWCYPHELALLIYKSWPGCSKLTTSLVNETLKFQTLISEIYQYFLFEKM